MTTKIPYCPFLATLLLWILVGFPIDLFSQDCGCIDCPVDIVDVSISTATFVVEDAENDALTTNQVETVFLKFQHSFPSELEMKLISPAGQAVTLIGPQGTFASAIFFGGFDVRFVSDIMETDPDPGMSTIWHNADLSGLNQYDGAYLPHSGSLQNFNTGTVNGEWKLEITDPIEFDFGELEQFNIVFTDQTGIECCEANAGDLIHEDITSCPGGESLLLQLQPTFSGNTPNTSLFAYTYLVSLDGILLDVNENPDLRTSPPGQYQIHGLSYELIDLPLIPLPDGQLTIGDIEALLDVEEPLFCADISQNSISVEILTGDTETFLQDTICQGDTIFFGEQALTETGLYQDTFSLAAMCDSVVVFDLFVALPDITELSEQTCDPNLLGLDTTFLLNEFSCDSLVIIDFSLIPNDTVYLDQETCMQELEGNQDTVTISTPECDSIIITTLFYEQPDTTFTFFKTCLMEEVGLDTLVIAEAGSCDDIQIVQTDLYQIDTTFLSENTCDINLIDDLIETFPTDSCDQIVITSFTYISPDTTFINEINCDQDGIDTLILANTFGCDSLVITEFIFVGPDTTFLEVFSCDSEDVGIDTTFLQNVNLCDSLVILNTQFSTADTTFLEVETCDINQIDPIEESFSTETCDSIVITSFIYVAPDTTMISNASCEVNQEPDSIFLQNQFGCDSLVINIYFNSVPTPTELFETTCDVNQAGVFSDTIAGSFCDSIITTTITLIPSDTTFTSTTTCEESRVGIDSILLTNAAGCDSLVINDVVYEAVEPTVTSIFTCDTDQVGIDTIILASYLGCDSLLINEFVFAAADTTFLPPEFTCDPSLVGNDTIIFTTTECDSLVISTLLPRILDTVFINDSSCDIIELVLDTFTVLNIEGCDSTTVVTTIPSSTSESNLEVVVDDPSLVGLDTAFLVNSQGCDSLVITNFILGTNMLDTSYLDLPTCNLSALADTMITNNGDVLITTPSFFLLDTTFITENTCDPNQLSSEIFEFTTDSGCDSVVVITYNPVQTDTVRNSIIVCEDLLPDTTMSSIGECPIIEITSYINMSSQTTFVENVSCIGPFGMDTLVLQNTSGCDSMIIITTNEANNSETIIDAVSCDPNQLSDTLTLSGELCDSLVITHYSYEEIIPVILTVNTCDSNNVEPDTLFLSSINGCDSLVITEYALGEIEPTILTVNTCDENNLEADTLFLQSVNACDSLVITTYSFEPLEITEAVESTCEDSEIGIRFDTLTSIMGCDSIVATTIIADFFPAKFTIVIEPSSCEAIADGSVSIQSSENLSALWLFDSSESLDRNNLPAAEYVIQLSQGVCDTVITIVLPSGNGPEANTEVTYVPCSDIGGNINANPNEENGPYQYLWENGSEESFRTDLSNGIYILTLTDAMGCTSIDSTEIINVTGLDFNADIEDVSCFGFDDGSIMIELLSGTMPYEVEWDDGSSELLRDNLLAGIYAVTISDVNNCNITLNRIVQEPPPLIPNISITKNDELEASATGGTPPYAYLWSDGSTTSIIADPVEGLIYEVAITDANGCEAFAEELLPTNAATTLPAGAIQVYPNPSFGILNLSADSNLRFQKVIVYDIHGRIVFRDTARNDIINVRLDLSDLAAGTYILQAVLEEGIFNQKIAIIKD